MTFNHSNHTKSIKIRCVASKKRLKQGRVTRNRAKAKKQKKRHPARNPRNFRKRPESRKNALNRKNAFRATKRRPRSRKNILNRAKNFRIAKKRPGSQKIEKTCRIAKGRPGSRKNVRARKNRLLLIYTLIRSRAVQFLAKLRRGG